MGAGVGGGGPRAEIIHHNLATKLWSRLPPPSQAPTVHALSAHIFARTVSLCCHASRAKRALFRVSRSCLANACAHLATRFLALTCTGSASSCWFAHSALCLALFSQFLVNHATVNHHTPTLVSHSSAHSPLLGRPSPCRRTCGCSTGDGWRTTPHPTHAGCETLTCFRARFFSLCVIVTLASRGREGVNVCGDTSIHASGGGMLWLVCLIACHSYALRRTVCSNVPPTPSARLLFQPQDSWWTPGVPLHEEGREAAEVSPPPLFPLPSSTRYRHLSHTAGPFCILFLFLSHEISVNRRFLLCQILCAPHNERLEAE